MRLQFQTGMLVMMTSLMVGAPLAMAAKSSHHDAPQQLQVPTLAYDESTIVLVWKAPEDTRKIVDYHIYSAGKLLGKASDNNDKFSPAKPYINNFYANDKEDFQHKIVLQNFTVDGLKPNTRYQFTVKAQYADGSLSAASHPINAKTSVKPQIVNVRDFGAIADGKTLNTQAIQQAIDSCKPGCRVEIPSGTYKSGALWLKSDMTLHLQAGATLLGSENPDDYPAGYRLYLYSTIERPASLINAIDPNNSKPGTFRNIRITGSGVIDGNGWQRAKTAEITDELGRPLPQYVASKNSKVHEDGILAKNQVEKAVSAGMDLKNAYGQRRSSLMTLRGVENVYLAGFTVRNPAFHGIMNLENHNVVANGLIHQTYDANNGDGIEFGNSQNVMVFNNFFDTGDDCINFAAGTGEKAQQQEPMKGAWLFNNYFRMGHGAIVTGSHTGAWIEDILAENNVMYLTDIGLRAKSTSTIGGGARNVTFRNNAMRDLAKQVMVMTLDYADSNANIDYPPAKVPAQFYDFTLKNVTVDNTTGKSASIEIKGDTANQAWHRLVHVNNVQLKQVAPTAISDLRDSEFNHVVFTELRGETPWHFSDVKNVTVDGKQVAP
ncbi:glycosyl hydrolase family 28 protein [Yersinia mollaretii]|uniref:glycosyl hydrolase family 28 protein n=1 Tax=Yersinia mollaretii TaxID=33060 RepID=UPI0005DDA47C|nr:glycoside hydrolase family 28 protein [Yersinia mollaretii]MDA5528242.1 glycoside hydrolase family 28 protein [Yersinia mollaretii]MDR7874746.1 glycoside hydrolase family 28 protein [Yersinia mollaretii]PHZ30751.1 exo-poly-alpha-D-galacturonosidase [Yersinia mollaretii]WQC75123.1 glycoside hydrolase family 28 protein [Yersinia mollaretii]CNF32363.1 exo-poly-alpha-D-galacturonosidase [Yersinia mollaretii]